MAIPGTYSVQKVPPLVALVNSMPSNKHISSKHHTKPFDTILFFDTMSPQALLGLLFFAEVFIVYSQYQRWS